MGLERGKGKGYNYIIITKIKLITKKTLMKIKLTKLLCCKNILVFMNR